MPWSHDAKGRQLATRSQTWVSSQNRGVEVPSSVSADPKSMQNCTAWCCFTCVINSQWGEAARRLPASNELRNDGSRSWLRRWDKGTWATQKPKAANLRIPNQEIHHQALHMGFSENIMPPNPLVNHWLTISFPTHGA